MRTGVLSFLLAVTVLGVPRAGPAQDIRAVGGFVGQASSRQLWPGGTDTSDREDILLGAFVDVALPVGGLGIMAEGYFVRRGSRVRLAEDTSPGGESLEARTDHLAFPLTLVARFFRNPLGVYAYGGPMVEHVNDVSASQPLLSAYEEESRTLFSVVAGVGAEALLLERWSLRVEGRVVEGLTEMFDGPRGDIRHRGTELLVRLGVRPPGQGPAR